MRIRKWGLTSSWIGICCERQGIDRGECHGHTGKGGVISLIAPMVPLFQVKRDGERGISCDISTINRLLANRIGPPWTKTARYQVELRAVMVGDA